MISTEEAYEIARRWARDRHAEAVVRLEAFELGYVVRRSLPEHRGRAELVLNAQDSMVIDGATREITPFATLPTAAIVRLYRAKHAAQERFSAPLRGLLSLGGWRPARDLGPVVDGWWAQHAPAGLALPTPVRAVLAEFGGLVLLPAGLSVAPRQPVNRVALLPVGMTVAIVVGELRGDPVAIDEQGRVWMDRSDGCHQYGESFDAALPLLLGLADGAG